MMVECLSFRSSQGATLDPGTCRQSLVILNNFWTAKTSSSRALNAPHHDEMAQITDISIKDADGVIIVHSITSKKSFNNSERSQEKMKDLVSDETAKLALCGNKCDIPDWPFEKASHKAERLPESGECCFSKLPRKRESTLTSRSRR